MPAISIIIGVMLILIGVGGYGASTGHASPTALIPSAIGLIIAILGGVATKENLRKHAMHAVMLIALLGFLGTVMGIPKAISLLQGAQIERPAAAVAQTLTAILCLILVVFGIKSFVDARRNRTETV
ncbi:MAG TPA: hypothetical protein VF644_08880 [Pyrinomonadaceae bacterium]